MMNPHLKESIRTLKEASRESGQNIWAALADELDKPKRRRVSVNLSSVNRHTQPGDVVAVPGKVLASGALDHPVTVAAHSFSEGARKKIVQIEGRAIPLTSLLEEQVEPSKIKILK
jgi:large subunit ribosomal protein L18e